MRPLQVMWAKQEARELTKQEELDYETRYTEWLDVQDKLRKYQEYQESQARSYGGGTASSSTTSPTSPRPTSTPPSPSPPPQMVSILCLK